MLPYIGCYSTMPNTHLEIINMYFIILMSPNLILDKMDLNYLDV